MLHGMMRPSYLPKPFMNAATPLNWGILAPGKIAVKFAKGLLDSQHGRLHAVGSRDAARARIFAEQHGAVRHYGSYEELLADPEMDAVYIATPQPLHAQWTLRAVEAGKHVLCEKPLGMNLGEAEAMFEAGAVHDRLVMEAFMYRCYPQTIKLWELIHDGAIGRPLLVEAAFAFAAGFNPESRLFNNALGGGGILDVGGYPVSMARLIAGAMEGRSFLDPVELAGSGVLGETGVDEIAAATLKFSNGLIAQCATGIRLRLPNHVRVTGSEGMVVVPAPWLNGNGLELFTQDAAEPKPIETEPAGYHHEIDAFAAKLAELRGETPATPVPVTLMSPEDSLGNMRALDRWRQSIGLTYDAEKAGVIPTVHSTPLQPGPGLIPRLTHPNFDKSLSCLAIGVDNQPDLPYLRTMLDDFIAKGGNVIDTAFIYAQGKLEGLLGNYLKSRPGWRDELVIITKGAHTPYCYPGVIGAQLDQSLNKLGLDYVDIYMMHRDNPEVPVDEFVEALNRELDRGRVRRFGVSNWTLERIRAFNEAAESKGLKTISVVSNQLSLATMVAPVWKGCVSAKDADMARWIEETGTLLLPWSSQARGFFTDRSAPDRKEDAELVRCWYSDENFERKRRAERLAGHYGVTALNIALAWVLARPYPVTALVGPRRLSETRTLLPALDLSLTPGECAWLDLETDQAPQNLP